MDLRDAFLRLKTRDKITLGVAGAATLTVVIMIFFFAFNGFLKGGVEFPESGANQYGKVQNQSKPSYPDLPYFIMFPETSVGVSVGGDEIGVLADGTAFRFSNEAYIVAAMPQSVYKSEEFIRDRFYSLLTGAEQEETCTYIHKIRQEGYMNKEYLEYEGGILRGPDEVDYYVLSYRQPSVNETDPMIAVVTTDKTRLRNAINLLDRMWRTLRTVEDGDVQEIDVVRNDTTVVTDNVTDVTPSDNAGQTEESYLGESDVADLRKGRTNMMRQTAGMEEAELIESFVIPKALTQSEVVFYMDYNNVSKTPAYVYLVSPSGEVDETPDAVNEMNSGLIIFNVTNPEQGTWKMVVSNDEALGQYHMMCDEKETFDLINNPPEGIYGRELGNTPLEEEGEEEKDDGRT